MQKYIFVLFIAAVLLLGCAFAEEEAGEQSAQSAGDSLVFGSYAQEHTDNDGNVYYDEPFDLEWIILDVAGDGSLLLLSRYGLEFRPFDSSYNEKTSWGLTQSNPTEAEKEAAIEATIQKLGYDPRDFQANSWEISDIRAWLNGWFVDRCFSPEEAQRILTSDVTPDQYKNHPNIGFTTYDKVFLLSYPEVLKYLPDPETRVCRLHTGETCWWWLRSPGTKYYTGTMMKDWDPRIKPTYTNTDRAAFVDRVGGFGTWIVRDYCAVRPAMWIKAE